jgi:hypothetical protein
VKRPCIVPQCPNLVTTGSRCPAHRGTREQRGYGAEHRAARRRLATTLPAPCGYCGVRIAQGERWDAAHVRDGRPDLGYLIAHPLCNQRARGVV